MVASAFAQEPARDLIPGERYGAGTRVRDAAREVSFILPAHWTGHIPLDSEALLLQADNQRGIGVVVILDQMTPDSLSDRLAEPQDFGESVVLQLSQPLQQTGSQWRASYLSGAVIGRARAMLGPDGQAIVYFLAGPVAEAPTYEQMLDALAASTQFGAHTAL